MAELALFRASLGVTKTERIRKQYLRRTKEVKLFGRQRGVRRG